MLLKKLVLIDGEYECVRIETDSSSEVFEIFPDLIKVSNKNLCIYVNPDMIVSLELADPNDSFKLVTSS